MEEERGLDHVTEVASTSWFRRIGQAFAGVLIGFLLIPVSVVLLFWNEGRAIKTARPRRGRRHRLDSFGRTGRSVER